MVLRLSLLRHAKSSWDDPGLDDHDRPLNARGRKAAALMGKFIAAEGLLPDRICSSTSLRTRQTLAILTQQWPGEVETQFDRALYLAEPDTLLAEVKRAPKGTGHLMLLGHNPGMEQFAAALLANGPSNAIAAMTRKYPTAGLAVFALATETWSKTELGSARLLQFVTPRILESE
jgi:phosphohistidine phosphatase